MNPVQTHKLTITIEASDQCDMAAIIDMLVRAACDISNSTDDEDDVHIFVEDTP